MKTILVKLNDRLTDRAGAAIALVALSMVALLSAVALAVDVGMLVTARTEAQTLADGAALEGARELRDSQGVVDQARAAAILAGSTDNTVRGENVTILPEDVDVIPDEWTVRVRVHRTQQRNSAIPTFFARIFGVNEVDITAKAAAWAVESTTIGGEEDPSCPALPLALLDQYIESNGEDGWQEPEEIIGWDTDDHGKVLKLKLQPSQAGEQEPDPVINSIDYCNDTPGDSSWRCWWRQEEEAPNTENVEDKIWGDNCTDPVSMDDSVYNAAGNMQSILGAFGELAAQDPDLEWCDDCGDDGSGCVVEAPSNSCFTGNSMRLRTVPVVDPTSINGSGQNINGHVIGFMGVFVEKVGSSFADEGGKGNGGDGGGIGQDNVYLRLILEGGAGTGGEAPGDDDEGVFVRTLQLIE